MYVRECLGEPSWFMPVLDSWYQDHLAKHFRSDECMALQQESKTGKHTSPSAWRLALWRSDSLWHLPKSLHQFLLPPAPGNDRVKTMAFRIIPREGKTNKQTKDSIRY